MKKKIQLFFRIICLVILIFSCKEEADTPIITPPKLVSYTIANGLVNNIVRTIAIDKTGKKWFGTDGGISEFDGTNWVTYNKYNGALSNNIQMIFVDNDNNKWICYGFNEGGVNKFNGANWTVYKNPNGPGNGIVFSITQDLNGNLLFGTLGGVSMYNGNNWTIYYYHSEGGPKIVSMVHDLQGNNWFGWGSYTGQDGGLIKSDGSTSEIYNVEDGLANNNVTCVAIDSKGNKWIGTNGFGISKFDGINWLTYKESDGLVNNFVNTIAIDVKDNVWIGTNGGVSMFDGKNWVTYNMSNGLVNDVVYSIAIDSSNGHKWIGTGNGITELED